MTDERSEETDEIENMLAQQLYDEVQFDELQSQLAANAATIAAQAAEIERLTEINDVFNETILRNASRYVGLDMVYEACKEHEATIAALRSQLDEQRKRLDGAVEYKFGEVYIWANKTKLDLIPIEGVGMTWHVRKHTTGATEPRAWLKARFKSFEEAYQAAIAANWLTPHAEKDGGE